MIFHVTCIELRCHCPDKSLFVHVEMSLSKPPYIYKHSPVIQEKDKEEDNNNQHSVKIKKKIIIIKKKEITNLWS